jgi:hypothetical protein
MFEVRIPTRTPGGDVQQVVSLELRRGVRIANRHFGITIL